jgi:hypothetical protein
MAIHTFYQQEGDSGKMVIGAMTREDFYMELRVQF